MNLIDEISEIVYVVDKNTYDLLYINAVGRSIFHIGDVKGLTCYRALQNRDEPCEFCTNSCLENNEPYSFTWFHPISNRYCLVKGKTLWWHNREAYLRIVVDTAEGESQGQGHMNPLETETVVTQGVKILYKAGSLQEGLSDLLSNLIPCLSVKIQNDIQAKLGKQLLFIDMLTKVKNRAAFIKDVEAISSNEEKQESIGIISIDMNGMREINGRYGLFYGDKILVKVANSLKGLLPKGELYRIAGDEFAAICQGLSSQEFDKLVRDMKSVLAIGNDSYASLGHGWSMHSSHMEQLIFQADERMYEDKKHYYRGRAISKRYRKQMDDILDFTDPHLLDRSILDNRFVVYLQPKMSVKDRKLIGAEALIRYCTPGGTVIMPDHFIPLLEEMRFISKIDYFVFSFICQKLHEWIGIGLKKIPLSVNFSRHTLAETDFLERINGIWEQYRIPKELLELEVTESVEEYDSHSFLKVIEEVRKAGYSISMDDFGVRNANLSLFVSANFDVLKIDRSLIVDIVGNKKSREVLQSVTEICKRMGIKLIVEGIETEEQMKVLEEFQCDGVQGYLFSKPITIEEYEKRLKGWGKSVYRE